MFILTLRTDQHEAQLGLYNDATQLEYYSWMAHRELAETLHMKIDELLDRNGITLHDIDGIAVYRGPGSFTGLRIGITVANALAQAYNAAIVGEVGDESMDWLLEALASLKQGKNDAAVVPHYGSEPNITQQKK